MYSQSGHVSILRAIVCLKYRKDRKNVKVFFRKIRFFSKRLSGKEKAVVLVHASKSKCFSRKTVFSRKLLEIKMPPTLLVRRP